MLVVLTMGKVGCQHTGFADRIVIFIISIIVFIIRSSVVSLTFTLASPPHPSTLKYASE